MGLAWRGLAPAGSTRVVDVSGKLVVETVAWLLST